MALNDNALVTRAKASTFFGITDGADAAVDAETERLINTASEMIAKRCQRVLYKTTHTEYYHGSRTNELQLYQWPITGGPADGNTKPEVSIDDDSLFSVSSALDAADYYVHKNVMIVLLKRQFPKGSRNIKVVYEAGLGNHANEDFPEDLQNACLEMCQFLMQRKTDRRVGVVSRGKSGENVTYELGVPQYIVELIEPYMRHDFIATNAPIENG